MCQLPPTLHVIWYRPADLPIPVQDKFGLFVLNVLHDYDFVAIDLNSLQIPPITLKCVATENNDVHK